MPRIRGKSCPAVGCALNSWRYVCPVCPIAQASHHTDAGARVIPMPMRTSWDGYLKLSLISVPVKAYNVSVRARGQIGFHLLHAKCHSRIRYKKVCPIHGEVPNDEIVSGYEHAKDQYVVVKQAS